MSNVKHFESANQRLLRLSLVAVWLITALVSWLEWQGDSTRLLLAAGLTNVTVMNIINHWRGVAGFLDWLLAVAAPESSCFIMRH
ncbi:hypothetical protein [Formosimonas limnophila]|uniref:hypothetical protein n=1 Tax=Formosimonas limnophila TaxID=1384487 RepID=UPI0016771EAB|nr:hypothetical protein [Formosimonas limnophila]